MGGDVELAKRGWGSGWEGSEEGQRQESVFCSSIVKLGYLRRSLSALVVAGEASGDAHSSCEIAIYTSSEAS